MLCVRVCCLPQHACLSKAPSCVRVRPRDLAPMCRFRGAAAAEDEVEVSLRTNQNLPIARMDLTRKVRWFHDF